MQYKLLQLRWLLYYEATSRFDTNSSVVSNIFCTALTSQNFFVQYISICSLCYVVCSNICDSCLKELLVPFHQICTIPGPRATCVFRSRMGSRAFNFRIPTLIKLFWFGFYINQINWFDWFSQDLLMTHFAHTPLFLLLYLYANR